MVAVANPYPIIAQNGIFFSVCMSGYVIRQQNRSQQTISRSYTKQDNDKWEDFDVYTKYSKTLLNSKQFLMEQ